MTIIADQKGCTKCQLVKPVDQFAVNRKVKSGRDSWCKQCRREYMRSYWHHGAPARPVEKQCAVCNEVKPLEKFRRGHECCEMCHLRAYSKEYRKRNKEKFQGYSRKRRPKERIRWQNYNATKRSRGSFTQQEWQALCRWFGGMCLRCGVAVSPLTIDHVTPISRGGVNTIDNLQPLCGPCNSSKNAKYIDYRDPDQLAAFLVYLRGE